MLGLPDQIRGCLFDLDGVLTMTAKVHAAAWQEMFDGYLRERSARSGEPYVPFDPVREYDEYVDGKPREDGTRSFLAVAGHHAARRRARRRAGHAETIAGAEQPEEQHRACAGSARTAWRPTPARSGTCRLARDAGLHRAVVSSSANCRDVLIGAGIEDLFEARVDGLTARQEHLHGKPAPDMFLAGARAVGLPPAQCAVFEDALAGVAAGRAGQFGCVIGVDRVGQADALRAHGADVVVTDLAELVGTP